MSKDVVPIFLWTNVADLLEQSELVVNDQKHAIVFVETLKGERGCANIRSVSDPKFGLPKKHTRKARASDDACKKDAGDVGDHVKGVESKGVA